jgi:hypothetical protein
MNLRALFALLPLVALLSACETTGDPREGGLFGWSETKARQRQVERRAEVAAAESAVMREQQRSAELQSRNARASRQLAIAAARAEDERARAADRIRLREASVRAKAALLEEESPTAATASRARKLSAQVEAVRANRALSDSDRLRQLHDLEEDIDEARASLKR